MSKTVHDILAEAQAQIAVPKGRNNDFGGYKYRKAEDIIGAFRSCGLAGASLVLTDRLEEIGGQIFVIATARLSFGGDAVIAEGGAMHALQKKGMDASQITGSASSYARKYALQGLFALDDGEADPDSKDNRKEEGNSQTSRAAAQSSQDEVLRTKLIDAVTRSGERAWNNPNFKRDHEALRERNRDLAHEVDDAIEAKQKAAA